MNVTIQQLEAALSMFREEMVKTISDKWRRVLGNAKLIAYEQGILQIANNFAKDGLIDVDKLKQYVSKVLRPCDGEFSMPIDFNVMGVELAKAIDIKIGQSDVDKFFNVTLPSVANK